MINMLKLVMSQEDDFTAYQCGDAALDAHNDGSITLYVANEELAFTRPDRLIELAVLLAHPLVLQAIKLSPSQAAKALEEPVQAERPRPEYEIREPSPPPSPIQVLDLAAATGRAAYCNGLIREQEREFAAAALGIGLTSEQLSSLIAQLGHVAEAVYMTAWVNGAKSPIQHPLPEKSPARQVAKSGLHQCTTRTRARAAQRTAA